MNAVTQIDPPSLAPRYGATEVEWLYFSQLYGLTADLLPVVSNPHSLISPKSKVKKVGKVPSQYNAAGHVVGFPRWTQYTATLSDVDGWSRNPDYGISVQTRTIRAIDVDVTDELLAQEIQLAIVEFFGEAKLARRGRENSPRFLTPFVMPGDFRKRKIETRAGAIEFLGTGEQFVACGTHPNGTRYTWEYEGRSELPIALESRDPAQFEAMWSTLADRFGVHRSMSKPASAAMPDWVETARKFMYAEHDTWFEPLDGEAKAAEVRAIAATWTTAQATNRETWLSCLFAIADAVSRGLDRETGVDIAEEFSSRTGRNNLADRATIEETMFSADHIYNTIYVAASSAHRAGYLSPPRRNALRAIPNAPQSYPLALPTPLQASAAPTGVVINQPVPTELLDLRVTRNGIIPDEENVRRILTRDPNLQGMVRYDEFVGDMILARPVVANTRIVGERDTPRLWSDADTVTLQTYIQRHIVPRIARDKIEAVVAMHARQNCAFHPVRDYLQSLAWDGTPRLRTWLLDYLGANSQPMEYLSAVGIAWLISAVARIMEPGCQVDSALVLEGPQGIRKSSCLRVLAGDAYFSDSLPADLAHKDARDHLRGKWIIELSELAQFKRAEIETVKAFISRRYEQYRPSYGRHEVKFPRQCVFAGSTNDDAYLVDTTGNRRFWAVACTRVDLNALNRDRDQLWAESVARYRAGEKWHLTGTLEELAAVEARSRIAHDPWTSKVVAILAEQLLTRDVSPGEVMAFMSLHTSEQHQRNAGRVGQILKDLGWRKDRRDGRRGQLYMRPVGAMAPVLPSLPPAPPAAPAPLPDRVPPPPPNLEQLKQEADLAEALKILGKPAVVTVARVEKFIPSNSWLYKSLNPSNVRERFGAVGYTPVENPERRDGQWRVSVYGAHNVVYGRKDLNEAERLAASRALSAAESVPAPPPQAR